MPHPNHPAFCPAWRSAALRVTPLDDAGHPAGEAWVTPAGTFADENKDAICTANVRALAEGRRPCLQFGGGAAAAFHVALATPAELLAKVEAYADCVTVAGPGSRMAAQVQLPRWVGVEVGQHIEQIVAEAREGVSFAAAVRDNAIAELSAAQDSLRIAENRRTELEQLTGHLRAATGGKV